MLWTCSYLEDFWKFVEATVSDVIETEIPEDPKIWLLGDVNMLKLTKHKKYFVLLASTAGKKNHTSELDIRKSTLTKALAERTFILLHSRENSVQCQEKT